MLGASEVALPELVSSLSTLLVLSPLALMPGMGSFLFRPMTMAVGFAMAMAYILSRTVVPTYAALFLKADEQQEDDEDDDEEARLDRGCRRQGLRQVAGTDRSIGSRVYKRLLDRALDYRWIVVIGAYVLLVLVVGILLVPLRREFFPIVDGGAFEMYVRAQAAPASRRRTAGVAAVEDFIRKTDPRARSQAHRLRDRRHARLVGRLHGQRGQDGRHRSRATHRGAREAPRNMLTSSARASPTIAAFADLQFAFNTGGLIRGALNEGKTTPINIRVTGKNWRQSHQIADLIRRKVAADRWRGRRPDHPASRLPDVHRSRWIARRPPTSGLTQEEVVKNLVAAFNSSIQFNKNIFWIDPIERNQYFVGVQYPLDKIESLETLLNVPITGVNQSNTKV